MQQYVLSLTAMAILTGMILALAENHALIRLLCGLLLAAAALGPLMTVDWEALPEILFPEAAQGDEIAAAGMELSREAVSAIIKTEVEAYIQDKAQALGCTLEASVTLGADQIPKSVWLQGTVPEEARDQLTEAIEQELGIPKENQRWSG